MRTEVLELKRACFCFPLRYSLILWGYFRMIVTILNLFHLISVIIVTHSFKANFFTYFLYFSTILTVADIVLLIVFIIGAHKKSVQLLKLFYFYELGVLIVHTLINIAFFIWFAVLLIHVTKPAPFSLTPLKFFSVASIEFIALIIKAYVLLLVRSEIIKLGNNCQFRFVNNAVEVECTMTTTQTGEEELGP